MERNQMQAEVDRRNSLYHEAICHALHGDDLRTCVVPPIGCFSAPKPKRWTSRNGR